ncbi:recombinase family protein [Bosea sp. 2RAB26]|uniref:recombinase family protein n=1 Tax=Bosea sp. 2RAB26 TaxID=3237476 RepID=UPI003F93023E
MKPTRTNGAVVQEDTKFALIYARVSSKKQVVAGDGLNSQLTACMAYAQAKGYEVEGIHTDDLSGSARNRAGLDAVFTHMQSNPDKRYRIIFDHINRFSRDLYLHGDLRRIVNDLGGILESPHMIYGNDSTSRLVENMSVVVSDYQRVHNTEQTNSRMRSRLTNGYAVFAAPVGYVYGKVQGHSGRVLVRNEPSASVVVESLEGYASGRFETVADVLRFCQEQPLFPKSRAGKITHQRIGQFLRNPSYAGLVGSGAWGIPFRMGHHEALVSIETYQHVQDRLNGINRAPKRRNLNEDFPLRGFVMCDDCGNPLTACWSRGNSGHHPYYLCHTRSCASYGKSIRRNVIEGEFAALLTRIAPRSGAAIALWPSKSSRMSKKRLPLPFIPARDWLRATLPARRRARTHWRWKTAADDRRIAAHPAKDLAPRVKA